MEAYDQLIAHFKEFRLIDSIGSVLGWDELPPSLLAALPAESTLLLLGRPATPGAGARVNVYRDVHRKNVRIEGAPVHADARAVAGALRLLANRRIDTRRLDVPVHAIRLGQRPRLEGRWAILTWSDR